MAAWEMLSDESRKELSKLLPPTAFLGFKNSAGSSPSFDSSAMEVDEDLRESSTVDPYTAFSNTHLLSAASTWQDHLSSGWLSPSHREKVQNFVAKVRAGDLGAPWKDDVWLSEHPGVHPERPSGANAMGAATSCLAGFVISFTRVVVHHSYRHSLHLRVGLLLPERLL